MRRRGAAGRRLRIQARIQMGAIEASDIARASAALTFDWSGEARWLQGLIALAARQPEVAKNRLARAPDRPDTAALRVAAALLRKDAASVEIGARAAAAWPESLLARLAHMRALDHAGDRDTLDAAAQALAHDLESGRTPPHF